MKILELCLSDGVGGLELYCKYAFERLPALGHETLILVRQNSFLDKHIKTQRSNVHSLKAPFWKKLPLLAGRRLARFCEQHAIDAIHVHHNHDLPMAALAKYYCRRPVKLINHRHMAITSTKKDIYHRFIYQQIDMQLVITERLKADYQRFTPLTADKIKRLYYGVNVPAQIDFEYLTREFKWPDDQFTVGLFGRISAGKGQHLLIEAIHQLKQEGLHINAVIIGKNFEPDYTENLHALVAQYQLQEQIRFKAFHPSPQQIMPVFDVVVMPSQDETFGLVLIEAMRCGNAVIGTNAGGVPEIIKHEQTGLLIPPEDADALAQALRFYYQHPEQRHRIALAGKSFADQIFNTQQHERELQSILANL